MLPLKINRERVGLGGDLAAMPPGISRSGGNLTAASPNQKPPTSPTEVQESCDAVVEHEMRSHRDDIRYNITPFHVILL